MFASSVRVTVFSPRFMYIFWNTNSWTLGVWKQLLFSSLTLLDGCLWFMLLVLWWNGDSQELYAFTELFLPKLYKPAQGFINVHTNVFFFFHSLSCKLLPPSLIGMLGSEEVFTDILDHQFILQYIIDCYKIKVLVKDIWNMNLSINFYELITMHTIWLIFSQL